MEDQVPGMHIILGVHRHFPEEIADVGMINDQCPKPVPKIIECEKGFGPRLARLVIGLNK